MHQGESLSDRDGHPLPIYVQSTGIGKRFGMSTKYGTGPLWLSQPGPRAKCCTLWRFSTISATPEGKVTHNASATSLCRLVKRAVRRRQELPPSLMGCPSTPARSPRPRRCSQSIPVLVVVAAGVRRAFATAPFPCISKVAVELRNDLVLALLHGLKGA